MDEVDCVNIYKKHFKKQRLVAQLIFESEKSKVGSNHPRTVLAQAFYASYFTRSKKKLKKLRNNFKESIPLLIDQIRNDSETSNISQKSQRRFSL